jgi:hypothetical protein
METQPGWFALAQFLNLNLSHLCLTLNPFVGLEITIKIAIMIKREKT